MPQDKAVVFSWRFQYSNINIDHKVMTMQKKGRIGDEKFRVAHTPSIVTVVILIIKNIIKMRIIIMSSSEIVPIWKPKPMTAGISNQCE
jgi:hypothetical protein